MFPLNMWSIALACSPTPTPQRRFRSFRETSTRFSQKNSIGCPAELRKRWNPEFRFHFLPVGKRIPAALSDPEIQWQRKEASGRFHVRVADILGPER